MFAYLNLWVTLHFLAFIDYQNKGLAQDLSENYPRRTAGGWE